MAQIFNEYALTLKQYLDAVKALSRTDFRRDEAQEAIDKCQRFYLPHSVTDAAAKILEIESKLKVFSNLVFDKDM